jgi:hypothetical protein
MLQKILGENFYFGILQIAPYLRSPKKFSHAISSSICTRATYS